MKEKTNMPTIAQIIDLNGQTLYMGHCSSTFKRRANRWIVHDHYVSESIADCVSCAYTTKSLQAAKRWATSKRRIKKFGENAKFYLYHM
jgi:hypothetical protein